MMTTTATLSIFPLALTGALALAPAAAQEAAAQESAKEPQPMCQPEPGQRFVGGPATAETGAAIMQATGATRFQWVFENSPVTMDYRRERVRVVYNRDMKVIAVNCG